MTISEAARALGIQPQSVYKKIYRQIRADGATPGPLFDGNGILTAQAEAIVRRLASVGIVPIEERGETAPVVTATNQNSAAAYSKLEAQLEIAQRELARVTAYLDDCDRLLLAMTRTVDALQGRVQDLEQQKRQSLRERFVEATRVLVVRPVRQVETGPEVYYSNVLARGAER